VYVQAVITHAALRFGLSGGASLDARPASAQQTGGAAGCRQVLGLGWSSVDLDSGLLVIDHQLQRVRRALLYRETKTEASDAVLPLPDIVTRALQERRSDQEEQRTAAGEPGTRTTSGPTSSSLAGAVAPSTPGPSTASSPSDSGSPASAS
jgi:hypothetical protein